MHESGVRSRALELGGSSRSPPLCFRSSIRKWKVRLVALDFFDVATTRRGPRGGGSCSPPGIRSQDAMLDPVVGEWGRPNLCGSSRLGVLPLGRPLSGSPFCLPLPSRLSRRHSFCPGYIYIYICGSFRRPIPQILPLIPGKTKLIGTIRHKDAEAMPCQLC